MPPPPPARARRAPPPPAPARSIMVPVPQYPLYSASLALYGGARVDYHLNEAGGWSLEVPELERALAAGRAAGLNVRGIAVINP